MKKKGRELKMHGALPTGGSLPPALQKAKRFLEGLPIDVVYSITALADEIGISQDHLQSVAKRLGEQYRYREGITFGYGNPETVKLKKEGFYDRKTEPES